MKMNGIDPILGGLLLILVDRVATLALALPAGSHGLFVALLAAFVIGGLCERGEPRP